jgi:CHASE2 domain
VLTHLKFLSLENRPLECKQVDFELGHNWVTGPAKYTVDILGKWKRDAQERALGEMLAPRLPAPSEEASRIEALIGAGPAVPPLYLWQPQLVELVGTRAGDPSTTHQCDQPLRKPVASDLRVIVIDIDRASIDALGAWPWPRAKMARLVEAVASARPGAIAIDVLMYCSPSLTIARRRRWPDTSDR